MHGQCQCVSLAQHLDFNVLVPELLDILHKILIIRRFNIINAYDDIAGLQSTRFGSGVVHHLLDYEGEAIGDEVGVLLAEEFRQGIVRQYNRSVLAVAFHLDGLGLFEDDLHGNVLEFLDVLSVDCQNLVTVAEAEFVGQAIDRNAVFIGLGGGQVLLALLGQQAYVNENGQQHIHGHAGNHDDEALPGRLRAELPRLRGLLHRRLVHRLVNHAGNLVVAAQREPAYAVFGLVATAPVVLRQSTQVNGVVFLLFLSRRILVFGGGVFLGHIRREELEAPLAVHLLATENRESPIEKEIELLDTGLEGLGRQEMAQFMDENQDG